MPKLRRAIIASCKQLHRSKEEQTRDYILNVIPVNKSVLFKLSMHTLTVSQSRGHGRISLVPVFSTFLSVISIWHIFILLSNSQHFPFCCPHRSVTSLSIINDLYSTSSIDLLHNLFTRTD
jgi:hypothetical protein